MASRKGVENWVMDIAGALVSDDLAGVGQVMRRALEELKAMAAAGEEVPAHLVDQIAEQEAGLAALEAFVAAQGRGEFEAANALAAAAFPFSDPYLDLPAPVAALKRAITEGDLEAARLALPGVALNCGYGDHGMPPLQWALWAETNRLALVEMLLEAGADPNFATDEGYISLHWLVDALYSEAPVQARLAELLVARGADIAAENHYGWTPMQAAVLQGTAEELAALLAVGSDPNRLYTAASMPVYSRGQRPLMVAAAEPEKVRLLLEHGADLWALGAEGQTSLDHLREAVRGQTTELAANVAAGEDSDWDHSYARDLQASLDLAEDWVQRSGRVQ